MNSNIREAILRAQFTERALDIGWMIYRPEADVGGVDFLMMHLESEELRKVQQKPRWIIRKDYLGRSLWIAFPDQGQWYCVPHDAMVRLAEQHGFTESASWKTEGAYSTKRMSAKMKQDLQTHLFG